jgi:hypothetical protein
MNNNKTIIHGRGIILFKSSAISINFRIMEGWFFNPAFSPFIADDSNLNLAFYGI